MISCAVGIWLNTSLPEKFQGLLQRVPRIKETSAKNTTVHRRECPQGQWALITQLAIVLVLFVAMRNILTKKQLREQGSILVPDSRLFFITSRKSQWQSLGWLVTSYVVRGTRKWRCACLLCPAQCQCSYIVQDPFLGNGAAHMGLGLFTSVSLIKTVPHSQPRSQPNPPLKFSSQVILGPV